MVRRLTETGAFPVLTDIKPVGQAKQTPEDWRIPSRRLT
jgi:hypothetical protein